MKYFIIYCIVAEIYMFWTIRKDYIKVKKWLKKDGTLQGIISIVLTLSTVKKVWDKYKVLFLVLILLYAIYNAIVFLPISILANIIKFLKKKKENSSAPEFAPANKPEEVDIEQQPVDFLVGEMPIKQEESMPDNNIDSETKTQQS